MTTAVLEEAQALREQTAAQLRTDALNIEARDAARVLSSDVLRRLHQEIIGRSNGSYGGSQQTPFKTMLERDAFEDILVAEFKTIISRSL